MKLNTETCCCIPLVCFTPFLLNQCAMKSKYVVLFVEASDPKVQFDAYRGRWRDSTRAWAWRRWTSSQDGVAGGAADGAGGQAQEMAAGGSPVGTGDAGPPRAGSSSDVGRRGTSSRGGSCRSTVLRATQQQRGGAGPMRRGGGG